MKRQTGHYCATWSSGSGSGSGIVEVVFFDGDSYFRHGMFPYSETDFNWISDSPITLEKPPIKMEVGSWYLFNNGAETMVGKCNQLSDGRYYIWIGNGAWWHVDTNDMPWYVDKIKILGGPFTTEELSKKK